MSTTLTVQLTEAAARGLRGGEPAGAQPALDAVRRAGCELVALHPGEADPLLAVHYAVQCADPASAQQLQRELLDTPGVDGAYIKPDTFLP